MNIQRCIYDISVFYGPDMNIVGTNIGKHQEMTVNNGINIGHVRVKMCRYRKITRSYLRNIDNVKISKFKNFDFFASLVEALGALWKRIYSLSYHSQLSLLSLLNWYQYYFDIFEYDIHLLHLGLIG